ncbi:MAG TPA: hypothetical protein VF323_14260 [Candidatus Limnocylindrales bacterium]
MLRVIMGLSAAIAVFLVVTRLVHISGLPVLEDQTFFAVVLALALVFGVSGAVVTTPPDSQAGYAGRLQRLVAALFLLFCIACIAGMAVWFLHYYGPPDVQKRFSF